MIKVILLLLAVPFWACGFLPAAAIVGASLGGGPLAPIIAGGLGLAGLFSKLFGRGDKPQAPQAPIDPYTGQVMGIDPKTGLNQRVVDALWAQKPPGMEWLGDAASFTDAQTGLPAWLVNRLNLATKYGADWMQFFKDNTTFNGQLPSELQWLLSVPWGGLVSDYEFGSLAPAQPPPEGVQGGQVPNEGATTTYPGEGQQPDMTSGDPTFSTTVYGQPQVADIPAPGSIPQIGSIPPWFYANVFGGTPNPSNLPIGVPTQDPYNSVPEPNPNNVPDYVAPPPFFSTDVYGQAPLPGAGVPSGQPPDIINPQGVPVWTAEGTAHPDQIPPSTQPIGTTINPTAPPPVYVPTQPMPIGGAPSTTTPPAPTGGGTPPANTPQIPIPTGGGGSIGAGPANFPVVGGGPLIQTVFGPIPAPPPPPSIIDFLRRIA